MMEAIILAGGLGTRLRSVVPDLPKAMADIQGRPFLAYLLDHLMQEGVRRVLLSVGYKHETISRCFGDRYGPVRLEYVVEHEPLGTGGAISAAVRHGTPDEVVVLNGDTYFPLSLGRMLEFHRGRKADITIALKPADGAVRYGSVVIAQDDRITGFREKSTDPTGYINGGVYILGRAVQQTLADRGNAFSFETDLLAAECSSLRLYGFVHDGFFVDIGVPEDYAQARDRLVRFARERTS